jgi:short subunit dehydrogenase-like uncharacterized protein
MRELDLVLFGATGFTGKLVAGYLAQRRPLLRWAIGGRSKEKLEQLRVDLDLPSLPLVVHDSLDATSMTALARRARVICSTVGPYAEWGSPLVASCAAEGTHYCDLSGEPDWVRAMIDAHHQQAVTSGARIVPSCGFDSIPSDLGVLILGEHFAKQGRRLASARLRVTSLRGGASGGTIASALGIAKRMRDPAVRRIVGDPYALNPEGERQGPDRDEPLGPRRDSATGHWLAPFIMAAANTRVVRRSNALAGYPWGRDFRYEEVFDTGAGAKGLASAMAMSAGTVAFGAAIAVVPGLVARVLPAPGQGPDRETREHGRFRITIDGIADDGAIAHAHVAADRDPGYGATAVILGEAAVCLAGDGLPARAGLLTPGTAMGDILIDRLRAAGIRFGVDSSTRFPVDSRAARSS